MTSTMLTELAAMPVEQVANRLGFPLENWPGSCYGVATALVESGLVPSGSQAVYGHWRGPIAATSMFAARRGIGLTGHGWVVTPTGRVVDPTRWVFEDVDPYVYVGPDPEDDMPMVCRTCEHLDDEHDGMFGGRCAGGDSAGYDCGPCLFEPSVDPRARRDARDYDEGGNQLRSEQLRPFPATEPDVKTTDTAPPCDVAVVLTGYGYRGGPLTMEQALWAANAPLMLLGPAAASLYTWLDSCGLEALVPLDNRFTALGGAPTAR